MATTTNYVTDPNADCVATFPSKNVVLLTLNRPKARNAIGGTMGQDLQRNLMEASKDANVAAVIVTGNPAGKAFCAGQDLAEITDPEGPALKSIVGEHYNPIISRIRTIEKPVIAAVNGVAAGAGANIALACDIVFAKKKCLFYSSIF